MQKNKRLLAVAVGLFIVVAAVFSQTVNRGFVAWDDNLNVYDNPLYNPVTPAQVAYFWRHGYNALYMPLTSTLWAGVAVLARLPQPLRTPTGSLSPLDPMPFHLVNLCLHLFNVLLVFLLLRRILGLQSNGGEPGARERIDWASAAGALVFGAHPLQLESVSWVTGLNNLLAGCFSLLALHRYLDYAVAQRQKAEATAGVARKINAHLAWATAFFVLAVLAKPIAVTLPLMAWALAHWGAGQPARKATAALVGWCAIGLAMAGVAWAVVGQGNRSAPLPWWGRPIVAFDALRFYLCKALWPLPLSIDYGRTPRLVLSHPLNYLGCLIPLAIGVWLWRARARYPVLTVAGAIFVAGLLPVLGFVPFYLHRYSTVGDRYMYLSMLGVGLAFAWAIARPWPAALATRAAGAALLAMWVGLTWSQGYIWTDSITLLQNGLTISPGNAVMHTNLGVAYGVQGRDDLAIPQYEAALRLDRSDVGTYLNLAAALHHQGNDAGAIAIYREALAVDPHCGDAEIFWSSILLRAGDTVGAKRHLESALRIDPQNDAAHEQLGLVLREQGKIAPARQQFETALRLNTRNAPAHNQLGLLLAAQGEDNPAYAHLMAAVELGGANAATHFQLGVLDARHNDLAAARAELSEALRLQPDYPEAEIALAVNLAQTRHVAEAIALLQDLTQKRSSHIGKTILARAHYDLGGVLLMAGRKTEVAAEWRTALAIQPDFEEARRSLLILDHNLQGKIVRDNRR